MEKIDNLDRQILEIIMRNARIPSKDVQNAAFPEQLFINAFSE